MSGTFTIKQLGEGQLPSETADLYTVPGSTQCIIKTITLVNTNISAETVNLYVNPSSTGAARRFIPVDTSLGANYSLIFDDEITLGDGDSIRGDTTTGSVVDYIISGVEES